MPRITKLKTLYCGTGGHDKVYGVAIVKSDSDFYTLLTFYGSRGKILNERKEMTNATGGGMHDKFSKIVATRLSHNYEEIDWKDPKYGMVDQVRGLGTPPGETEPVKPVQQPSPQPRKPVVKSEPTLGRSLDQREFL